MDSQIDGMYPLGQEPGQAPTGLRKPNKPVPGFEYYEAWAYPVKEFLANKGNLNTAPFKTHIFRGSLRLDSHMSGYVAPTSAKYANGPVRYFRSAGAIKQTFKDGRLEMGNQARIISNYI